MSHTCPCGSGIALDDCCGKWHQGQPAPSAERLMRSRYSAYTLGLIDYLVATTLPAQQAALDRDSMRCTIYEVRPLICREFEMGSAECRDERQGMAAIYR